MSEKYSLKQVLPHRYPFLLLDKIIECTPGKSGKALKNVTINEPYFPGHFPEDAVVPGVLIIESCAQLVGYVCHATVVPMTEKVNNGYLASIQKFNFREKVVPGDQMILAATIITRYTKFVQAEITVKVKNNKVAAGILIITIIN